MKLIRLLIPALLGAGLVFFFVNGRFTGYQKQQSLRELNTMSMLVQQRIGTDAARIVRQLEGFSRTVSADRDFSMKLIVEGDRSAPEVSEIATRYMESMDFSLLLVADSSLSIISCGHFPATAGNTITPGAIMLDTMGVFLFDELRGQNILTLQARVRFAIAETPLSSIGGITVDSAYLARLRPREDVGLVIKQEKFVLGTSRIETMSGLKNNEMIVNDTAWLASAITLPYAGKGDAPVLYILMRKPAVASLMSLK